jgi:ADP-heptose:LPS heptosyltransferase
MPAEKESGTVLDTAATILNLDLIISVDTMVAHLAGALGKRVWTLLPFSADWRWMADRQDSPWYPTMRLFRQPKRDDWLPVISEVVDRLHRLVSKSGARRRPTRPTNVSPNLPLLQERIDGGSENI